MDTVIQKFRLLHSQLKTQGFEMHSEQMQKKKRKKKSLRMPGNQRTATGKPVKKGKEWNLSSPTSVQGNQTIDKAGSLTMSHFIVPLKKETISPIALNRKYIHSALGYSCQHIQTCGWSTCFTSAQWGRREAEGWWNGFTRNWLSELRQVFWRLAFSTDNGKVRKQRNYKPRN